MPEGGVIELHIGCCGNRMETITGTIQKISSYLAGSTLTTENSTTDRIRSKFAYHIPRIIWSVDFLIKGFEDRNSFAFFIFDYISPWSSFRGQSWDGTHFQCMGGHVHKFHNFFLRAIKKAVRIDFPFLGCFHFSSGFQDNLWPGNKFIIRNGLVLITELHVFVEQPQLWKGKMWEIRQLNDPPFELKDLHPGKHTQTHLNRWWVWLYNS